jgi:poly(ADP-ribose) polymerase-like protein
MTRYVTQIASTGRAKCRGCERGIARGTLRFGESLENPRAEGRQTTFWYHPRCVAYKRPEALIEFLDGEGTLSDEVPLRRIAEAGREHPRLARIHRATPAPSARATCRSCRALIEKGAWRISVVFYEDGYLNPAGYIHAKCVGAYAGTTDSAMERIEHFNPDLSDDDRTALRELISE